MSAKNKAAVFGVVGFCFLLSFVAPVYGQESESECVAYKKNYDEAIAQKKTPPAPAICDETTPVGPVRGHCVVGTSVCKGEKTAENKDPSKPDVQVDTSKNNPTYDPDSLTPIFTPDGKVGSENSTPKTPPPIDWRNSVLQGGILNSALNPPVVSEDVWQSPSADSFNDLIQQQLQSDSGASSQNQDTGLGATLQRWGASVFGDGNSQTLTPVDANGEAFGDPVQVQTFNPSEGAPGSTFAQPDTSVGQKDESLCGWTCTVRDYAGKALDAVLKEFSGTAEAKPGPVSCSESTACGSAQKGTGSWYNCGTGGDSGPCIGTRDNPLNPRHPTIASGYPLNTVVWACSGGKCVAVVSNDDGGFRGNKNYDGGRRIADFSPAAFQQLAPLSQGVVRDLTLNPVAQFSDYKSALEYANSLNQVPVPQGNPLRAAESAINASASSFYTDYELPSGQYVTQQFLDASSGQIQSDVLASANQTYTAAQSNPDFSTSGDTGIAVDTSSGSTGNQVSVPDNFVPNPNPDFSTSGDTGIAAEPSADSEPVDLTPETVAYDSLLPKVFTANNSGTEVDFSAYEALGQEDIANAQSVQDIEDALLNDRLALADEQERALEAKIPKPDTSLPTGEAITQQILKSIESQVPVPVAEEGYIPTQEEIISDFVPKPETVAVTPDQIKEQVRLAQNAEKEEFTVAKPADLARIMATPAISGHLSLDMIQKLKSFTNDDEFGTFTNEELEKGIEWADLPKNAYPAMAQIAKDAGFEAPPFQESNNRDAGIEDTVSMSRKLEALADTRLVATIDDMMEQNRSNNPGPVGGVEFEVNKILAENPIDTWDAPASAYRRVFGVEPEIFATSDEIAEVADEANFLDNVGTLVSPLNDEPSLGATLDENNPPIADESEIKIADDSSSENLKGCASESCVGGELGDARSRPMSPEEQALQKQFKDAEAKKALLEDRLGKLPENTNVAALTKQAQTGLDAMHPDRKPTPAELKKIRAGKTAVDQLQQIAAAAGDQKVANQLAVLSKDLASIDADRREFQGLSAQNPNGDAGVYATPEGKKLVDDLKSDVSSVKEEGPGVLASTRNSNLPGKINGIRDTLGKTLDTLNSQIADSRQSFYALQEVNTARIPDTWASQSNPSFDPPVVVSDVYTSGSVTPTAYVWEPPYPSENVFSTQTEIDALFPSQTAVVQPSSGIDYSNDPEQTSVAVETTAPRVVPSTSEDADNPIVTSSNLGSQDAGISKVSEAIDITTKTPAPVVADAPKDFPLSDGPSIPIEGGNERAPVLSDAQVDEKVRAAFDTKLKDAEATVRYAQDLLARSESQTARLLAQTAVDEAQKRLAAVEEASAAYKEGNPSPELQKVIERIRTGDDAGLFSQGLSALSEKAHQDAAAIAKEIPTEIPLSQIPKALWDMGAWGVASGVGMIADSGRNLLEKLDVVGFRADTDRELSAAIDPIGSEWKTVADVAVIAPFGTGLAKSAIGAGVDTAIDVGAAATRSAFGKVVESEAGLLVRDSAGFATTLERDAVARAAGDAVAAGETRLPGVTIRQGADDLPVPRNVANENIPLDAEVVQAARPARGAATAEAEGIAAEVPEQAPRVITTRGIQNPGDDLAKVANDNNAAAPRVAEPPAGEVVPVSRTAPDVVPEVPTTPVEQKPWYQRAYESVFGENKPTPAPVVDDIVPLGEIPEGVRPVVRDFELPRTSEVTPTPAPRVETTPEIPPTLVDVVDSGLPGPASRFDLNPVLTAAESAAVEAAVTPKPWWLDSVAVWSMENPGKALAIGGTAIGGTAIGAAGIFPGSLSPANLNPKNGSGDVPPGGTPPAGGGTPPPAGTAVPGKDAPGVTPPAGDGGSVPAVVPPPVKTGDPVPPTGEVTKPPVVPPPVKTDEPVVPPPGTTPKPCGPNDTYGSSGCNVPYKPPVVEQRFGPVTPRPDNSNVPSLTNPQKSGGGGIGGVFSGLMSALSNLFGGSQSPQPTPTTPAAKPPATTPPATASSTKPLVTLVANPATIPSARTSRLVWSSINADQCALFSNGRRMGVVSTKGATTTPPLSSTTSFTVRCATTAGIVGAATTTVNVPSGSGSEAESTTPTASTEDISAPSNTTDISSNSDTNSDGGCDPTWNLVSYANCLLGK